MTTPEVFVVRDRTLLIEAVAARLVTHLVDRLSAAGRASVLIAADDLITELLEAISLGSVRDAVDWTSVSLWWSNDVWDSSRRRHAAALSPVLERLGVLPANVHPVPARDEASSSVTPEDLAADYASQLASARGSDEHGPVPSFDLALLAVGAEGSVAGLHPEQPSVHDRGPVTVDRIAHQITLTAPALSTCREVWLLADGAVAAPGIHLALSAAGRLQVPAADVRGEFRTLALIDEAAANRLPHELRRFSSP